MSVWGSTQDLALRLTERRSVSGTPDEASYSTLLRALIAEANYFRRHADDIWLEPIEKDWLGRSVVMALVRGTGSRTIVLAGHFDTVPTSDYGELESLATSPVELSSRIVARLRANEDYGDAKYISRLRACCEVNRLTVPERTRTSDPELPELSTKRD